MADVIKEICALCKKGEEAESLKIISKHILAHANCLLFSPRVTTTPQQDSQDSTVEFNIPSVISEIKRGEKLRCGKCKKCGATVGCNHDECNRTYHYPCVTEAKGIIKRNEEEGQYIIYCREHANSAQLNNGTETSGTSITPASSNKPRKNKRPRKRKKKRERSTARKKMSFRGKPESETVQNAEMHHDSEDEQRRSHQLLDNHADEEDKEVPGPSRTHLDDTSARGHDSQDLIFWGNITKITIVIDDTESEDDLPMFDGSQLVNIKEEGTSTKDDTSVTDTPSRELQLQETLPSPARERTSSISKDSSVSQTPKISRSLSLSGFPKRNRKRKRKRDNPKLETALLTMHPDERQVYSQLYDDIGGSFPLSEDICDDEQMEDTSRTVEDIPKVQHTGTKGKSDGSNFKIAALESSMSVCTPEGQSASFTPVHDAQLPRHTPGVTSSPSRQLINVNNKVKSTDGLRSTTFHPANVANGSERLASTNGKIMTSADSANGVSNARAQPKDTCNGKDKLVSSSAIYCNLTKLLVDQPLSSNSTNKASDKQQFMESPNNISSEQQNNDTKNRELVLADLIKTLKKHAAQNVSRPAPSKTLGSANNDILSDTEPLSSPSLSKTSNAQPMNLQSIGKSSEKQCKQYPGVSKSSDEKPTGTANTTRVLVHAVNSHDSDVPVDHTAKVRKRQSQSVAHLPAITTGAELLNGQHSHFSLVDNKCTEMAAGFPSAKKALLTKEALTYREETPATSPGIPSKGSKAQNATCHPSPLHKEAFSKQLKRGFPASVGKPMNLGIDQKSKLMESYKEAEKQMSRTGDMTKAAQAFWDFCRENRCRELLLTRVTCYMKSVFYTIVHEEPKYRDFEQAFAFLQASGCFANFMNGTEDDQVKISSRTRRREAYNESDSDSAGSCTEVEDQGEITRDEDPAGMESGSPESSQMSNKLWQCTRDEGHDTVEADCSKTSSLSVNSKEMESSRDEDHNGVQSKLSESSLESNRKEESCRSKEHDDILSELLESCSESSRKKQSTEGEDIDRMETEFPAASLFSPSASRESDLILPENASPRRRSLLEIQLKTMKTNLRVLNSQLQTLQYQLQQAEDGDAGFATNLIQFLRKVPEDKKLSTQTSIINVLSSVLDQQPMSTSNPGCLTQQYTNPSSPRLSGLILPPKP